MKPDTFAMTARLETALRIMLDAYAGQTDKSGQPYILHCLRVGLACAPNEDAMIVGLLHDAIEDSSRPADIHRVIGRLLGTYILARVMDLTKCANEPYVDYINRIKARGGISITVKLADLYDNLNIRRLQLASDKGHDVALLVRKYTRAVAILTDSQKIF